MGRPIRVSHGARARRISAQTGLDWASAVDDVLHWCRLEQNWVFAYPDNRPNVPRNAHLKRNFPILPVIHTT